MTTAPTTEPRITAKLFLFDNAVGEDSTAIIGQAVGKNGLGRSALDGLRHLSGSSREAVNNEIGAVTEKLLDVDMGDALVGGWRKYAALAQAARRTLAAPGSEEVLSLASHTVTWTSRPQVDLLLDGVKLNSFEFEITFVFELTGVSGVIRAGNLVALSGGKCVVTGKLSLEGARIVEKKRHVDLGLILRLTSPLPLLGQAPSGGLIPIQSTGAMSDDASPEVSAAG
jgi:hypothetical protein